jgi:hypothetical protein
MRVMWLAVTLLTLLGAIPSPAVASSAAPGLVNERVTRTVDLTTQLAVHRLSIHLRNAAAGGLGTYTLALPAELASGLASVKAATALLDHSVLDDAVLFAASNLLPVDARGRCLERSWL